MSSTKFCCEKVARMLKLDAYAGRSVDIHVSRDLHQAVSGPEQAIQVRSDDCHYAKEW